MIEFSFHYAHLQSALAFLSGAVLTSSLFMMAESDSSKPDNPIATALFFVGVALAIGAASSSRLGS